MVFLVDIDVDYVNQSIILFVNFYVFMVDSIWLSKFGVKKLLVDKIEVVEIGFSNRVVVSISLSSCILIICVWGNCGGEILELWINGLSVGLVMFIIIVINYYYSSFNIGE